jgi:D-lactate dehydrogenase
MTAGTTRNSYRTVASMTLVLPGGTVVDTADPAADAHLARAEPELCARLLELKAEIEADPALCARIRAKHRLKNTNGYRLDALLDGDGPAAILRGLMVGSQGTLGFVAETVFDTLNAKAAILAAQDVLDEKGVEFHLPYRDELSAHPGTARFAEATS